MTIVFSDIYITQSMTGPSAPSDDVTASSQYSSEYAAWEAFIHDNNSDGLSCWISESSTVPSVSDPEWLKYHFDTPKTVKAFKFKSRSSANYNYPSDFKLQGSNNDSDWTDLFTKSGYTDITNQTYGSDLFLLSSTGLYSYYRLLITDRVNTGGGNWVSIGKLELYGSYYPATPFMLSASSPSGIVSSDSYFSSDYYSWEAFNGFRRDNGCWISEEVAPSVGSPKWLKYDFESGNEETIGAFAFRARNSTSRNYPSDFKLQGSNNDSDWTDLYGMIVGSR